MSRSLEASLPRTLPHFDTESECLMKGRFDTVLWCKANDFFDVLRTPEKAHMKLTATQFELLHKDFEGDVTLGFADLNPVLPDQLENIEGKQAFIRPNIYCSWLIICIHINREGAFNHMQKTSWNALWLERLKWNSFNNGIVKNWKTMILVHPIEITRNHWCPIPFNLDFTTIN